MSESKNILENLVKFAEKSENKNNSMNVIKADNDKRANLEKLSELALIQEATREVTIKTYNDSFLYHKGDYEKNILEFIMKGDEINKNDPSFENIVYMVKRQPYSFLVNILLSNRVVLLKKLPKSMPRSFKVFAGKDIRKGTGDIKVYIDVTGVITEENGTYNISSSKLNELVSYLTSAMTYTIYHVDPIRLIGNTKLVESGTNCFSLLFAHIIDYLRMGGVENVRGKSLYLSALYYQLGVLKLKPSDSIRNRALKFSKLTSKEAEVLEFLIKPNAFENINNFIENLAIALKIPDLRIDNFIEKWIYLYKSGTQFAVEYFPAFASMMTNAYHGAYIVNQLTIEKVTNNGKELNNFVQSLLQIGRELM